MSTATELLRRALEIPNNDEAYDYEWAKWVAETQAFLEADPEAEPVEIVPREWRQMLQKVVFVVRLQTSNTEIQSVCKEADLLFSKPYLHPPRPEPARKPMTREEIIAGVTHDTSDDFHAGYWAGIRWAEKHHGIGGDDPETDFGIIAEKREWQGLTDEERDEVSKDYGPLSGGEWTLMLLVEQALKEKNGG